MLTIEPDMEGDLLFVYGTLRRDGPEHALIEGCRFMGEATIRGTLLDLGAFPGLVAGDHAVRGEVYAIDCADRWSRLDAYEGFDPRQPDGSRFVRAWDTARFDSGERVRVQLYRYNGSSHARAGRTSMP